jgi:hypothetical protein
VRNGAWHSFSIQHNTARPLHGLQPGEDLVGWSADSNHVFTRTIKSGEIEVSRLDIDSGKRETWQIWKPKNPAGVMFAATQIAITPDGHQMVFAFRALGGTLYRSDTLH